MKYTLVQHSGAGYAGKPGFTKAVEEMALYNGREVARVAKAGGLILNTYNEAYRRAESENYPPEVKGVYPQARGSFHPRAKVDGLKLYIPAKET